MGEPIDTVLYGYNDGSWGDLLTSYDGQTITHDNIGNPLFDGTWTYTWEQGRQLASMSNGTTTWDYTYDANGMRTSRSNGTATYRYVYNGGQLSQMTVGGNTLTFTYDVNGTPAAVTYNGTVYYYITTLQGDVLMILNADGDIVVDYTYDAWGRLISSSGTMASTLGTINPLRYRGYVYDNETELYYLQSRYYNPELGRFINADALVSTGQGILGNNMFAYCNNNSIIYTDSSGYYPLQSAFELLATWFDGDGEDQHYSKGSRMVKQLKKSPKMQSYIDTAIENHKGGQSTTKGTGEFTSVEDGYELYLSTQHFNYTITVTEETRTAGFWWWKHEEIRYTATITVYDTYNFDALREWNSFGSIMNNLAYIYHIFGGGSDYAWKATYTYTTKWTDTD